MCSLQNDVAYVKSISKFPEKYIYATKKRQANKIRLASPQ